MDYGYGEPEKPKLEDQPAKKSTEPGSKKGMVSVVRRCCLFCRRR